MRLMTLTAAWNRLREVRVMQFSAKSSSQTSGWSASGDGTVIVGLVDTSTMIFTERGNWRSGCGKELEFNNVYRWTLAEGAGIIRLEHLRFGRNQPIYLLDLAPTDDTTFHSVSPHYCGEDSYTASMEFKSESIYLRWTVKGPKKDEQICCIYGYNSQ
jgi:hypothetical protein